jgi:hypothetical protein
LQIFTSISDRIFHKLLDKNFLLTYDICLCSFFIDHDNLYIGICQVYFVLFIYYHHIEAVYSPFLYTFRWKIEVAYYEQKTFWSLCSYMICSRKGIELLVNLIHISYCAMKLFPYLDDTFSKYRTKSVPYFRFSLSEQIRTQIFYANFAKASKQVIFQFCESSLALLSRWHFSGKLF